MTSFIRRYSPKLVTFFMIGFQASAELPMITEGQWLGYFAVASERNYQLTVNSLDLSIPLKPVNRDGAVIESSGVNIAFGIMQTSADAVPVVHALRTDTLESSSPATADLKRVSFRCKTAGDAVIEISIEKTGGGTLVEGSIVESGTLPKDSLKPLILLRLPSVYAAETQGKSEWTKDQAKDFEKQISKDRIRLKWLDGMSETLKPAAEVDDGIKKSFGSGIVSAEFEFSNWQGKSLHAITDRASSMSLTMAGPSLLHEGFEIACMPSLKSTDNKARIQILIK